MVQKTPVFATILVGVLSASGLTLFGFALYAAFDVALAGRYGFPIALLLGLLLAFICYICSREWGRPCWPCLKMRKPMIGLFWAGTLYLVAISVHIDVRTRSSTSYDRIFVTKQLILQFAHEHNRLPASLAELPELPGYGTSTIDAWKRPLDFVVDSAGTVTLRSLGADTRSGGTDEDQDIVGVFASRAENGKWRDDRDEWSLSSVRLETERPGQKSPSDHRRELDK